MDILKNPSNARLLFDKLDLAYINENMVGKEFENNWLECKEKSRANHGGLDEAEQAYLAKALSGFANTSGGVLLFGVEARKKEGVDQIQAIKPIQQLKRFESALREYESRAVERPVPGVEYKPIRTEEDTGMLAIFIPESPHVPHRSLKDKDFYLRAGGVFSSLPLTLIEDLLFRRIRPQLKLRFTNPTHGHVTAVLVNEGKVGASWPQVVMRIPDGLIVADPIFSHNSWRLVHEYGGRPGPFLIFLSGSELMIHPQSEVPIGIFRYHYFESGKASKTNLRIWFQLVAENMLPLEENIILEI